MAGTEARASALTLRQRVEAALDAVDELEGDPLASSRLCFALGCARDWLVRAVAQAAADEVFGPRLSEEEFRRLCEVPR